MSNLIYLTITRLNIIYAIRLVSQFMHELREVHWKATLNILTDIKGSLEKRLLHKKNGICGMKPFSDSSYAGDTRDKKSTSAYHTYIGGNLVTWRSKK